MRGFPSDQNQQKRLAHKLFHGFCLVEMSYGSRTQYPSTCRNIRGRGGARRGRVHSPYVMERPEEDQQERGGEEAQQHEFSETSAAAAARERPLQRY